MREFRAALANGRNTDEVRNQIGEALRLLVENCHRMVPRDEIVETVWGVNAMGPNWIIIVDADADLDDCVGGAVHLRPGPHAGAGNGHPRALDRAAVAAGGDSRQR